jgi:hypothetical protein
VAEGLADDHDAGRDHVAAVGLDQPRAPLLVGRADDPGERLVDRGERDRAATCERRQLGGRAVDVERTLDLELRQGGAHLRRHAVEVASVPFGQPDAAEVEARPEVVRDQLGRAAADVHDDRAGRERPDAAERHRRLLVAGQQARCEPVGPFDLAQERLAVLGVAYRARRNGEYALGAQLVGFAPEVGERVADARDRDGEEAPARIDSFAEPGDPCPPRDLGHVAVRDVGDEEAGGVGAEVDRGDPRHLRGTRPRIDARRLRGSSAAARITASSWSDPCRCVIAVERRSVPAVSERARFSAAAAELMTRLTS